MNKPIRVLQIGMTKNIGGLETYLMQQFRHLDRNKVTYDFVNITSEDDIVFKDEILKAGSKIYGVRSRHSNPIRHYWQWIKLLHKIAPEYKAIVLNSNSITYVFPIFIARFFGIPMRVMHSHNAGYEQKIGISKKIIIAINRILLRFGATDYFACSKVAREWMFGKNAKFKVIPDAIDAKKFEFNPQVREKVRSKLGLTDNFVIGHVGRFSYQKNHEFLIDIFSEIYKRNNKSKLLLIGDAVGDLQYLNRTKQKVHDLGIEKNVLFLGMRNDVPELMQAMDCFVLPSRFEGLAIVGIEAQAAGLPSFFSDSITKEVGITNLTHFLSLKQPAKDWAEEILNHMGDPRKKMSGVIDQKGYSINGAVKTIQSLYEK